jgi:hypothetical protein
MWTKQNNEENYRYRFSRQGDNAVYEYGTFSSSGGREEERRVISERVRRQSAGILGRLLAIGKETIK